MSWYTDWVATATARNLSGTATPAALAADAWALDGDPTGKAGIWELSASTAVTVTGLLGGKIGRQVVVLNVGAQTITLAHAQISAKASVATGVVLAPSTGALLWIEPTTVQFSVLQTAPDPVVPIVYKPINELGPMATARLLGRTTAGAGPAEELTAAAAMALLGAQALDSDLTAIAALATTSFGRSFLALADAAAARTLIGAQPVDSDLTAIAALTTTSYGRAFLALADAAAARTAIDAQQADSDLAAIAALATTSFGRSFLALADAAATRTLIGAGTSSLALASTGTPADLGSVASRGSTGTAADAGHVHKAPGTESNSIQLTATVAATTGFTSTGLNVTLPAGTYIVSIDASLDLAAGYGAAFGYIYNNTIGVALAAMPWSSNNATSAFSFSMTRRIVLATSSSIGFSISKTVAGGTYNVVANNCYLTWAKVA